MLAHEGTLTNKIREGRAESNKKQTKNINVFVYIHECTLAKNADLKKIKKNKQKPKRSNTLNKNNCSTNTTAKASS